MKSVRFVLEIPMGDLAPDLSGAEKIEIAEAMRKDLRGCYCMGVGPGPDDATYNINLFGSHITIKPL